MSKLLSIVLENPAIFWDISQVNFAEISDAAITERVINYGQYKDFLSIFTILGPTEAHQILLEILHKQRSNIRPAAANFARLYLKNNYGQNL